MRAVDMFAGWGGFTAGAEEAGIDVVWAANHWPLAVVTHQLNHPGTLHICQDLRQADWAKLPAYEVLLAGPACQGHSSASQPRRRPYHDALRATAWAVVDCADETEPEAIVVENVPAFVRWRLFEHWKGALEALGYTIDVRFLTASHFGAWQRCLPPRLWRPPSSGLWLTAYPERPSAWPSRARPTCYRLRGPCTIADAG